MIDPAEEAKAISAATGVDVEVSVGDWSLGSVIQYRATIHGKPYGYTLRLGDYRREDAIREVRSIAHDPDPKP